MDTILKIGSWEFRKSRLKEKFPVLTDNDLELDSCNRVQMFGNLKNKLNVSEEELHKIIISL